MPVQNIVGEITNWWRNNKNSQISKIAISFVNARIKDYGKVSSLTIDTVNKNILLKIFLIGEKQNITVSIEKYEVVNRNGTAYIRFNDISVSKLWIDSLIKNLIIPDYMPDKVIEINKHYARIVNLLI